LFDALPTVRCSAKHLNAVVLVKSGYSGGIVVVERRVVFRSQRSNLLGYLWIEFVVLLGKGRQSNADCKPARVTSDRIFIG
jgi:hypothetical protein